MDFQLRSFVDPKPVELWEGYAYISKVCPKPPCLIAKMKLGVSVHWGAIYPIPHAKGRFEKNLTKPQFFENSLFYTFSHNSVNFWATEMYYTSN